MYQVGLLAKPSVMRYKVKSEMKKDSNLHVVIYSDVKDLARAVRNDELKALIILVNQFSDDHIMYMDELTHQFPKMPIIFVSTSLSDKIREEVAKLAFDATTVIHYHYEINSLNYLLNESIMGRPMHLRSATRYGVNQRAYLQNDKGQKMKVNMMDISTGGMRARLTHTPPKKGTPLKIIIPKGDAINNHVYEGYIAWVDFATCSMGICFKRKVAQEEEFSLSDHLKMAA